MIRFPLFIGIRSHDGQRKWLAPMMVSYPRRTTAKQDLLRLVTCNDGQVQGTPLHGQPLNKKSTASFANVLATAATTIGATAVTGNDNLLAEVVLPENGITPEEGISHIIAAMQYKLQGDLLCSYLPLMAEAFACSDDEYQAIYPGFAWQKTVTTLLEKCGNDELLRTDAVALNLALSTGRHDGAKIWRDHAALLLVGLSTALGHKELAGLVQKMAPSHFFRSLFTDGVPPAGDPINSTADSLAATIGAMGKPAIQQFIEAHAFPAGHGHLMRSAVRCGDAEAVEYLLALGKSSPKTVSSDLSESASRGDLPIFKKLIDARFYIDLLEVSSVLTAAARHENVSDYFAVAETLNGFSSIVGAAIANITRHVPIYPAAEQLIQRYHKHIEKNHWQTLFDNACVSGNVHALNACRQFGMNNIDIESSELANVSDFDYNTQGTGRRFHASLFWLVAGMPVPGSWGPLMSRPVAESLVRLKTHPEEAVVLGALIAHSHFSVEELGAACRSAATTRFVLKHLRDPHALLPHLEGRQRTRAMDALVDTP